ncbi:MAG: DUF350 domain-containing protein [Ignavibacteriales bacterium]|nr:DUF350 domain-containing protein [Ignavibacteriales bacterium]
MDTFLLLSGALQIILSLFIGIIFIFLAFKIFVKIAFKFEESEELKKNNVAVAILTGAIIFSVVLIMKTSLEPAVQVFAITLRNPDATFMTYLETVGVILGHIVLSAVISFIGIYIAMLIFMWLTKKIDEMAEIKSNNIAVSILLSIVILSMALLLNSGIKTLLDALVPFPQISLGDIGF